MEDHDVGQILYKESSHGVFGRIKWEVEVSAKYTDERSRRQCLDWALKIVAMLKDYDVK